MMTLKVVIEWHTVSERTIRTQKFGKHLLYEQCASSFEVECELNDVWLTCLKS
jgi:hypothetical protein